MWKQRKLKARRSNFKSRKRSEPLTSAPSDSRRLHPGSWLPDPGVCLCPKGSPEYALMMPSSRQSGWHCLGLVAPSVCPSSSRFSAWAWSWSWSWSLCLRNIKALKLGNCWHTGWAELHAEIFLGCIISPLLAPPRPFSFFFFCFC